MPIRRSRAQRLPSMCMLSLPLRQPTQRSTSAKGKAFSVSVLGTTNQSVTWSVAEGANGSSVDQTGFYTAPLQPGTYHVVATSQYDTHQSGSATIVVPSGSASGTVN